MIWRFQMMKVSKDIKTIWRNLLDSVISLHPLVPWILTLCLFFRDPAKKESRERSLIGNSTNSLTNNGKIYPSIKRNITIRFIKLGKDKDPSYSFNTNYSEATENLQQPMSAFSAKNSKFWLKMERMALMITPKN